MPALSLAIGNRNYSSWSMRPWVLLRQAGIAFDDIQLWFDDDARIAEARRYSPTGQVPVLLIDGEAVWDTLAICETVAELFPDRELWPADARARRLARSVCAEMHAGFHDLRAAMPMNIRASYPGKGMNAAVARDVDRVVAIWEDCRSRSGGGGKLLFGGFTIPDAYFAPVVMRFLTYAVAVPPGARAYMDAVCSLTAVAEWMAAARRETSVIAADEPYSGER